MESKADGTTKRSGQVELNTLNDPDATWYAHIEYQYYWSIILDDMMPMIVLN